MNLIGLIDSIAGTGSEGRAAQLLDRIAFAFLVVMVVCAPHSIAATQTAWLIGMTAWIIRLFVKPRPSIHIGAIGIALVVFFLWTAVSAVFSYEPAVSIDKLRAAAGFLIFLYAINVVRNRRAVYFLSFALIGSCMISVVWTPIQKLVGRGVEVHGLASNGPLARLGIREGDTLLRVDGQKIGHPSDVINALNTKSVVRLHVYRTDWPLSVELSSADLNEGVDPSTRLGFSSWNRSSNFRAAGFYGHYTTYAEVLQLIGALAFGLLIAVFTSGADRRWLLTLAVSVGGIAFALLLTVTRASQLAFVISSIATVFAGASRKVLLAAIAIAVPVSAAGLYFLQQQRQVGFFDAKDGSIQYRQMMWRDGVRLLGENPRHMIVGVGMDSIKTNWQEWRMYDNGFQPMGHFHSTPVQLAVERGIPALLIWLTVLGVYARSLWRGIRSQANEDWRSRGILLGCLGGLVGFFASGLVHYNLGDSEVAMVFYLLMGFGVKLSELSAEDFLLTDSPLLRNNEPELV